MSTTIDERVVSMQFDNQKFESNVQTTMSTLDKLKQKLNLTGASKGLENVSAAANRVNMSGLGTAIETVHTKFSALEVMGVTALANITNSAVNAGKRMVAALTIQPIKTGFNEYEMKMDSVKTIMASTGESVETVNKYLNELNEYSDQTIYSFSDMTQNIGKFTNAGVKLEDAVLAIKGISNEAAVSGANANEASRAMYNFAQALSAGHVKLIDWKSIELANMATVEFKEQLIQAAVGAGTLTKAGNGMYKTLDGSLLSATKNFNESLNDQWMTTEVLVSTLKDYANAETEIGKKAFAAAQDVTKFSQMFDILKETAQSGWAKTWELIVGDIESAKKILTPLTNFLTGIIQGIDNFRNRIIEGALYKSFDGLSKKIDSYSEGIKKAANTVTKLGNVVDKVINGEFGNGKKRWDKLTEAGYNWAEVQNKVNEKLGDNTRHTVENTKQLDKQVESQGHAIQQLVAMSDAQLEKLGFDKKEIEALREIEKQHKKTGKSYDELLKSMSMTGRELIVDTFANIGKSLKNVFAAIKGAWTDTFGTFSPEPLYNVINAMHSLSEELYFNKEKAEDLKWTFKGLFAIIDVVATISGGALRIAFRILCEVLKVMNIDILSVTGSIGKAIVGFKKWLTESSLLAKVLKIIVSGCKAAGRQISKWIQAFLELPRVKKILEAFKSAGMAVFEIGKDIIMGLINGIKDGSILDTIKDIGQTIIDTFKKIFDIHSPSRVMFDIGKNIIEGLLNGIKWIVDQVFGLVQHIGSTIVKTFMGMGIDWERVLGIAAGGSFIAILYKIADAVHKFSNAFDSLSGIFDAIPDILKQVPKVVKKAAKVLNSFAKVLNAFAFSIRAKALKDVALTILMLVGAIAILTFLDEEKVKTAAIIVGVLVGVLGALIGVMGLFSHLSTSTSKVKDAFTSVSNAGKVAMAVAAIGGALLMMGITMKIIGSMDPEQYKQGIEGLIGVAGTLLVLLGMVAIAAKSDGAGNMDKAVRLFSKMGIAMLMMAVTLKIIGSMENPDNAMGIMFTMALIIGGLIAVAGKCSGPDVDKAAAVIAKVGLSMLILTVTLAILSKMAKNDDGTLGVGLILMTTLAAFMACMIAATSFVSGKDLSKLGRTLLAVSLSLLILAGVLKILATIKFTDMLKGVACMVVLAVILGALAGVVHQCSAIGPTQKVNKLGSTLIAMSIALAIMAGVCVLLGFIKKEALEQGITAMSLLGLLMMGMIAATKGAKNCKGNIVAMTVAIGIMAGSLVALSFIPWDRLWPAMVALGALMGMFALMTLAAGKAKGSWEMVAVIGVLSVAMVALGEVMYRLKDAKPESVIATASSIGILLAALIGSLAILNKIKASGIPVLPIIGMVALMGALAVLLWIMKGMGNPLNMVTSAVSIGVLLLALATSMKILNNNQGFSLGAFGCILGIAAVMYALTGVLAIMKDMNPLGMITSAVSIGLLMIALTGALWILNNNQGLSVGAALSIVGIAAVMYALTGVLAIMQNMDIASMITSAAAISGMLIILVGALAVLSNFSSNPTAMVSMAIGLGAMSVALIAIGTAFMMLSGLSLAQVGIGLLAIGGALTIMGVAAYLLSPVVPVILALSVALVAIGTSCVLAGTGLYLIASGLTMLSSIGASIPMILTNIALGLVGFAAVIASSGPIILASFTAVLTALALALVSFASTLIVSLTTLIPQVVTLITTALTALLAACVTMIPLMVDAGMKIILGILKGIRDHIGEIVTTAIEIIVNFINAIASKIGDVIDAGFKLIIAFINGLADAIRGNTDTLLSAVENLFDAVIEAILKILKGSIKGILSLGKKIMDSGLMKGIKDKIKDLKNLAKDAIEGFKNGLKDKLKSIGSVAKDIGSSLLNGVKDALGINSPSREMFDLAVWADKGLIKGLESMTGKIAKTSGKIGNTALNAMRNSIAGISDMVDSDIDSQPTIRPVLDLSDVRAGAGAINGMFAMNPSVGVMANVGSISSMMNTRQVITNADVVSAISDLKDGLSNTSGNSYTINGITYDDGSNVSNAIKTLINAARIERRV